MKICIKCGNKIENEDWQCPHCRYTPQKIEGFNCFAPEFAQSNDGFNVESFSELFHLEDINFWFTSRNELITWFIKKYFPKAENLLEIGCGTGFVLSGIERAFPNMTLFGSEIYSQGLALAKKRLKTVELFQIDARDIPFENEFDVIGAFDVLEHIDEDIKVIKEMYKATKPQGGIIITVPQHQFLWSKADEEACHVRRYTKKDLTAKIEEAGFKIISVTSFVTFLFPLMLISRLTRKEQSGELKINGSINAIFKKIMNIERLFITHGVNMPFGGSLLIIAKKV